MNADSFDTTIFPPFGPVLPSVAALRHKFEALEGLPHVQLAITAFADPTRKWTLESAVTARLPLLMRFLLAQDRFRGADKNYFAYIWNEAIDDAASRGDLDVLESFVHYHPHIVITRAPIVAASTANLHIIDWLRNHPVKVWWPRATLRAAVTAGSLPALRRLPLQLTTADRIELAHVAIDNNHLLILQWLWLDLVQSASVAQLTPILDRAPLSLARWLFTRAMSPLPISIDRAGEIGDLNFIIWASSLEQARATTQAMDNAAAGGHLHVVLWLHGNRTEGCSTQAIDRAAGAGHVAVVDWLFQNRSEGCSSAAVRLAAANGHLQLLQNLLRRGIHFPDDLLDLASATGHLDVVEFLTASNLGGGSHNAIDRAAGNHHVHVVEWLLAHRADGFTTRALEDAAAHGDVDFVLWLRAHGFPTSPRVVDVAAAHGRLLLVLWLSLNAQDPATTDALDMAASAGHFDIVDFLVHSRIEGCTSAALDGAMANGHFQVLRLLYEDQQVRWTPNGLDAAARRGDLRMLRFAKQRGGQCSRAGFTDALREGHYYVARWIAVHFPQLVCDDERALINDGRASPQLQAALFPFW